MALLAAKKCQLGRLGKSPAAARHKKEKEKGREDHKPLALVEFRDLGLLNRRRRRGRHARGVRNRVRDRARRVLPNGPTRVGGEVPRARAARGDRIGLRVIRADRLRDRNRRDDADDRHDDQQLDKSEALCVTHLHCRYLLQTMFKSPYVYSMSNLGAIPLLYGIYVYKVLIIRVLLSLLFS